MRTASISRPSGSLKRYFKKPSSARRRSRTSSSGHSQAASSAAPAACDRPRTDPGGSPTAPSRWTRAKIRDATSAPTPKRRDRRRQRGAIQVAQVQRFERSPDCTAGATVAHCPDAPPPRPPARRLAPDPPRRRRPRRHAGHREGRGAEADREARTRAVRAREPAHLRGHARRCWSCCRDATPAARTATIRKILEFSNIQQSYVHPFKVPTEEERAHDFLWRAHKAVPRRGHVALFNRSHYEDVLAARVHQPGAGGDLEGALRAHQRVRAADRRRRRHRAEVLPAHQRRRAGTTGCARARRTRARPGS